MDLGIADDGERADHEQAASERSPCLLILPSLSLPPLECCFGTSPIQAEKLRPDLKAFGSSDAGNQRGGQCLPTDAWNDHRRLMLISLDRCHGRDQPIELQNLLLESLPVGRRVRLRHTRVERSGTRLSFVSVHRQKQLLNTIASGRSHDPENSAR